MKPMDIIDALDNVDKGLLLRSEQPVHQRSRLWDGVKIAAAAALLVAVGIGGFLLLRGRTSRSPEPIPAYSLPVFETREPTDPPLQTVTPVAYSTNWEGLQKTWAEESALLAEAGGVHTEHTVTYYGDVPEEYRKPIRENSFYTAKAFGRRLLVSSCENDAVSVMLLNLQGTELSRCTLPCSRGGNVPCMTTTSDQGFLFVLDGSVVQADADGEDASRGSPGTPAVSTVIKCASGGSVEWQRELEDGTFCMPKYCFEVDGAYYFFGMQQSPESEDSPRDVGLLCLNADGSVRTQTVLEGSRDDRLLCAAQTGDGFDLYVDTQSSDGQFPAKGKYIVRLDAALNFVSAEPNDFDEAAYPLDAVDGGTLLSSDARLVDFPYGNLGTVVDLGDRLLTVSEYYNDKPYGRNTEFPGILGGKNERGATVYAAFDKRDGTLLWRAVTHVAPDRSPDEEDGWISLWEVDEETRPLEWLVKVPERDLDDPGSEESYLLFTKEIFRQNYQQYIETYREELEGAAKDMLRLNAQSSQPNAMNTFYLPGEGLRYDASAQTDVDTEALSERLRKHDFDSVVVYPATDPEVSDACFFSLTEVAGNGDTFHIYLFYYAEPLPELPPDGSEVDSYVQFDEHWGFVFTCEPH